MADKTEIDWCDSSFNPWIGCTKVGPGCDNCYAEADFDKRKHRAKWGSGQERSRTSPHNWKLPIRWNAKPFYECACGWRGDDIEQHDTEEECTFFPSSAVSARRRVFCASLGDVFDNEVPEQWRRDLFDLIRATQNIDWLLLTKRIGNVQRMVEAATLSSFMPGNVWLGATICNQAEADRDIAKLLSVPARVRFLSMEPLLGPVDLSRWLDPVAEVFGTLHHPPGRLSWVVAGGESGPRARPMHPEWVRSLRDQCVAAGVAFLLKQWGEYAPTGSEDAEKCAVSRMAQVAAGALIGNFPHDASSADRWAIMRRVGKKAAGRMLDGQLHNEFPEARP